MEPLQNFIRRSLIGEDLTMKIYRQIVGAATDEEAGSIVFDKSFPTSGFRVIVDLYLEKGIKKFGWNGRTAIEVKSYLDSRTLSQAYKAFNKISDDVDRYILFYHKTNYSTALTFDNISDKFVVIAWDDFIYLHNNGNNEGGNKAEGKNGKHKSTSNNVASTDLSNPADNIDWKDKRRKLLEELKRDIESDRISLFIGAGVSSSANMPGWEKLLQTLLMEHTNADSPKYLDCDFANVLKSCSDSYLIAARYINSVIDKSKRAEIIQQTLYADRKPSTLIDSICNFIKEKEINQIITTNYDQLIEQKLKTLELRPYSVTHHGIIPKDADVVVYHVHGSVNDPENPIADVGDAPVLSEEDYHELYATGHHWSNTAILHAFQHSHCIFIGSSMSDPNLRRLLEYAYNKTTDVPHYVFLCRKPLYPGYYEDDMRNRKHYIVQEDLMSSLGAKIIWYELDNASSNPHHRLEDIISELTEK